jgi:hypothetical protein
VRAQVAAKLAPFIPAAWAVVPHTVKQVATLSRPTVYIEHTGIGALGEAPVGHVSNTVVVTVLSDLIDWAKAEDALDVPVLALITDIDGDAEIGFESAAKTSIKDTYLGWAITLTVTTAKEA